MGEGGKSKVGHVRGEIAIDKPIEVWNSEGSTLRLLAISVGKRNCTYASRVL
jgi:hypothetical protein